MKVEILQLYTKYFLQLEAIYPNNMLRIFG